MADAARRVCDCVNRIWNVRPGFVPRSLAAYHIRYGGFGDSDHYARHRLVHQLHVSRFTTDDPVGRLFYHVLGFVR